MKTRRCGLFTVPAQGRRCLNLSQARGAPPSLTNVKVDTEAPAVVRE